MPTRKRQTAGKAKMGAGAARKRAKLKAQKTTTKKKKATKKKKKTTLELAFLVNGVEVGVAASGIGGGTGAKAAAPKDFVLACQPYMGGVARILQHARKR